jgi:UDP-N-acetylmuramoylalanine--D-glutamate ligase
MPADALRIKGRHNASNALAALALCTAIDIPMGPLLHGLREYKGEPHRMQSVAIIEGVEYIDDSKGTNVGATLAALNGLGQSGSGSSSGSSSRSKIILIAGGEGKGQDFSPLSQALARHAKAVILIGRDAPAIKAAIESSGISVRDAETLERAVDSAAEIAESGDLVLLSPACASFDMFKDYAHRAQVFIDAVNELASLKGQVSA